jgi:hypothetical protein
MRKLLALSLLLGSLALGGCQYFAKLQSFVEIGTASIANPVTKDRLYQMESAATIVFAGLSAWKKDCAAGVINANCRQQIAAVQVYTRQIPPYLAQLRTFVKNNDQVNAVIVWNQVQSVISTVRAQAAQNNVNIGG